MWCLEVEVGRRLPFISTERSTFSQVSADGDEVDRSDKPNHNLGSL
jgi:hypothetical protein